jgi:hypothetical protein
MSVYSLESVMGRLGIPNYLLHTTLYIIDDGDPWSAWYGVAIRSGAM